ncbi:hypothetical protein OFB62_33690, partial [Escherichia coli]|nr:hypothetical protein [Escherichia coli]
MLRPDEFQHPFGAMRPSAARIFYSSPGRLPDSMRVKHFIYANRAGLYLFRDTPAAAVIARPDACRQTEPGIVG